MEKRLKFAFFIYLLLIIVLVAMGILYLATPTVMPYHQQALGVSWTDISPGGQVLLWLLVKVVGICFLIITAAIAALLFLPYRRGERWAVVSVALLSAGTCCMTLWASLHVYLKTGANTPWPFCAFSLLLAAVAIVVSLSTIWARPLLKMPS